MQTTLPAAASASLPPHTTFWQACGRFLRTKPLGTISLFGMVVFLVMACFAEWIAPYDPLTIDYNGILAHPSWQHWMGNDNFGRDLLSRIIYGARTAMLVGYVCAIVGSAIGLVIGVASAYFGGKTDLIIQR